VGLPWKRQRQPDEFLTQKNSGADSPQPALLADKWMFYLNTAGWSMLLVKKLFGMSTFVSPGGILLR
jgi:hypothetical protein